MNVLRDLNIVRIDVSFLFLGFSEFQEGLRYGLRRHIRLY